VSWARNNAAGRAIGITRHIAIGTITTTPLILWMSQQIRPGLMTVITAPHGVLRKRRSQQR